MSSSSLSGPVVLDATLSDEKIRELLDLRTEYPELDFKEALDLSSTKDLVELAKDVGAMQVLGGYILIGVDRNAALTEKLDEVDLRAFDEANLTRMLRKYLPDPLEIRTRVLELDARRLVAIFVGRHPSGCAIFRADGKYQRGSNEVVRFRAGDVFWRNGTSSERLDQQGFEAVVSSRIEAAKEGWMSEQRDIRRRDAEELREAYESRQVAKEPLGAVNLDLESSVLTTAALELVRADDEIAIEHLFLEAAARGRDLIERVDIEPGLVELLDKLACLGAAFLTYRQMSHFERVVATLSEIFTSGFGDEADSERFGRTLHLGADEVGPRVWLTVIERVYALGALAVRRRDWAAVHTLAEQLPDKVDSYYGTWLRYTLTMSSRAQHLDEGQNSLLSRTRADTLSLACVRPDGANDDAYLTSLAGFDFLSCLVAIDVAGHVRDSAFFTNFARFRQARIQSLAERVLADSEMRKTLFARDDSDLAAALVAIGRLGHEVGLRVDGFESWARTPVGEFIAEHTPADG